MQSMLQFWTYFPHTPDNSFLGTVVEERQIEHKSRRSNKGLIYGKEGEVIKAPQALLSSPWPVEHGGRKLTPQAHRFNDVVGAPLIF